jgi:energy-coupling factor transport system permease protein
MNTAGGGIFVYRRIASPLHATRAAVGASWVLSLTAAALLLYHPLVLGVLLLAAVLAARASGVGGELRGSLRMALIVAVPIVLVNVLVSREGLTVFARLGSLGPFGQGNLTLEAVVFGAVVGLKVAILILLATLGSLAVDPDELLRIVRRLSFRSALTTSLAIRMIPLLAADSRRIAEAQRTRPDGGPRGTRGRVALIGAVLAGSLDRAMDVAATLEVRGFAVARRAPRAPRPWSRHDIAFAASAVAILTLALTGRLAGAASFDAYPLLHVPTAAPTAVLCGALLAAVLPPFCDRRGIKP